MTSPPLTQKQIEGRLNDDNLDELLRLWWKEQGEAKKRDLALIASALPFSDDSELRVLDLACGPGDVGRAIHARFPNATVDCVDRDAFLLSMCTRLNRRAGVQGATLMRDLWDRNWPAGIASSYDVVATANALHWLDAPRAAQLFTEIHALTAKGGVFLFAEPACAEQKFASGFQVWKASQPSRYSHENWWRFWSRANQLLGYDHTEFLGPRDPNRIDVGMTVSGWIKLLRAAGFGVVDVVLRDADEVVLAAMKI